MLVARPSIDKSVNPSQATVGNQVTYTIDATIPAGIKFWDGTARRRNCRTAWTSTPTSSANCISGCPPNVTATPLMPQGNADGSTTLAWFFGDITSDTDARVVRLVYKAHVDDRREPEATPIVNGNSLTNTARMYLNRSDKISGTPPAIPTVPGTFDGQTNPDSATVNVVEPKLVLDKDVSGDPDDDDARNADPSENLTYTLTVTNTGTSPAYDVRVTDQPDSELRDIVPTDGAGLITDGWTAGDPDMAWMIPGPIAPGQTVTLRYTGKLAPSAELNHGQQAINTADVPSYWGVPAADRAAEPGRDYRNYDDVARRHGDGHRPDPAARRPEDHRPGRATRSPAAPTSASPSPGGS